MNFDNNISKNILKGASHGKQETGTDWAGKTFKRKLKPD